MLLVTVLLSYLFSFLLFIFPAFSLSSLFTILPFSFFAARTVQSYEKSSAKQKNSFFFCRDRVISPSQTAMLRKKLVKNNGFWKINANRFFSTLAKARIRPKIMAKRGKNEKVRK